MRSRYMKAILAVLGAVATTLTTAQVTTAPTSQVAWTALVSGVTALAVFLAPNRPAPPRAG